MSDKNKRTSDKKEISHSLGNDFKIFRNSTKFSIPLYPSYSRRAVVAFCTGGRAKVDVHGYEHLFTKGELVVIFPGQLVSLSEISQDFTVSYFSLSLSLYNDVLSEQRKVASTAMASQLVKMIIPLGMPNTRFRVDILPRKEPESDGMDDIRFMFSANKSAELQPVAQTASGGEISRLMLCIKAMIAGFTALPTIIFDEVDTGVSGDIADKMGDIMQELGTKMQVFAITHLPQIAAKGQAHYFVYKKDTKDRTLTRIKQLEGEERVNEVARMLSGASLTEASLANAKDLLGIKD